MQQNNGKALPANPLQLPISDRDQAACKRCHRILTVTQWTKEGCKNCQEGPLTRNELKDRTTQTFYGHVGIVDSGRSWIARLVGCEGAPSGVYAARVANEKDEEDDVDARFEE